MSRDDQPARRGLELLAHAFSPAEWSGRWLAVGIVVFALVATVTVIQRALVAESATAWIVTAIHGLIVALLVPALSLRSVREWRVAQMSSGAPE